MIKVYGVPQSRTMRTLWMLEELGLTYENVPVHFATGDTHKPDYLALNPNGHIPTLDDGGFVIWESMAINLYLAEKYGKGLWPATVEGRGLATQWSFWIMTEVEGPLLECLLNRAFLPAEQRKPELADAGEAKLQKPFGVLNGHLQGRSHLLGDSFTVADVNLAAVLAWTRFGNVDLSKYPNIERWLGACISRPAAMKAFSR